MQRPRWLYDEMRQVGTDYADPAQAERYDAKMAPLGEAKAAGELLGMLRLQPGDVLVDLGAGTGTFAIQAAGLCRKVHAVDVSAAMLACARRKAEQAGLTNVEFHHAGFLTYEHEGEPADAIVSFVALHHLPDAWKQAALWRMASMLRPGGRLLLRDVVWRFAPGEYEAAFGGMVQEMAARMGDAIAGELERHIAEEFSTFDWIVEGMIRRAGLRIEAADYRGGLACYLCSRPG